MQIEASDAKKSNVKELFGGNIAGTCSQGPTSSPPNEILGADCGLDPFKSNADGVGKLQSMLAAEETAISEAAVNILSQKIREIVSNSVV